MDINGLVRCGLETRRQDEGRQGKREEVKAGLEELYCARAKGIV